MTSRSTRPQPVDARRRRRVPRPLDVFAALPEARSAAAMDDEQAARRLMDDLLALVDAGLIVPLQGEDGVRYAPADPGDLIA